MERQKWNQIKTRDAHCPPSVDQPSPSLSWDWPLAASSTQFIHWPGYFMECNIPLTSSAVLTLLPSSFMFPCWLAGHRNLNSPWWRVNTQQQLKHQFVLSIILILNLNHSILPTTRKKIKSVPVKMKGVIQWNQIKYAD